MKHRKFAVTVLVVFVVMTLTSVALAQSKPATESTKAANAAVLKQLPFSDQTDFENAKKGFIAEIPGGVIKNDKGRAVWDITQFDFIEGDAPDTVNPSLWRQGDLITMPGLYKVTDNIYQVRGYDLSNMSIIKGKTGWIIIDPLLSAETGKAALQLVNENLGERPVVAVIYTHSHIDHYGGVRGVVNEEDVKSGKVKIIAPEGFVESSVSENVIAGNVMSRRAAYMYGNLLPKNKKGMVGAGLGPTTSTGSPGLLIPTDIISKTGQKMTVDGIEMEFLFAPDSEAPAEMLFYFPQFKAIMAAEVVTHAFHNLYTLRGAKVRNGLLWSKYLNESIDLWGGDAEIIFASHHWPTWGNEEIVDYLKKQRDLYRYIHDQTLRLANEGYTPREIAEIVKLPDSLDTEFYNRGYYGTVSHNVRAQYQLYLGWFDGNPANLHKLPPVEAAKRYVEFMGGSDAVIANAKKSYNQGDYRWVTEVMNHVVFAEPANKAARELQADALEQLGYQAESGPWRNFYLTGAKELRDGVKVLPTPNTASPDTVRAMTIESFLDFLGVRLNGPKADGKDIKINFDFTDTGQQYALGVENSALHYTPNKKDPKADATIILTRPALNDIILGTSTVQDQIKDGSVKIEGNPEALNEFIALLDNFELWFNIVTP
jgi:alkyl sulfatase BDS1-like metallo-beta-lactamase superfamily hydrolase